jgi:hypothetical protein
MSSSPSVRSSRNAKKREPGYDVTCFRCGLFQTVKSFKRHFPQCLGSSNLQTSVRNDTLVPPIDPETVKSFKRHFPQCLGSSNLQTSVRNDTLVPPIHPDKCDCDPMVDDLSEPDFVY